MTGDHGLGAQIITQAVNMERITSATKATGRIIMATGRGGTGKSTFVALAARYLKPPLLLLDIDPDQSLSDMLGVKLAETEITTEIGRNLPIKTLSDLTEELEEEDAFLELGGGPVNVKIPILLKNYTYYQSENFDLISLGPRWTQGDYRIASFLFEFVIPSIGSKYRNILLDSPAGLEHLNRRPVPRVDDLFIIVDPSTKSINHVERVKKIMQTVRLPYEHLYLVGNHQFDAEAKRLFETTGETYLGKMNYDDRVKEYNLKGKSLWKLPKSSPACLSIKKILSKAGYEINASSV